LGQDSSWQQLFGMVLSPAMRKENLERIKSKITFELPSYDVDCASQVIQAFLGRKNDDLGMLYLGVSDKTGSGINSDFNIDFGLIADFPGISGFMKSKLRNITPAEENMLERFNNKGSRRNKFRK
jgi:hypothetical protein